LLLRRPRPHGGLAGRGARRRDPRLRRARSRARAGPARRSFRLRKIAVDPDTIEYSETVNDPVSYMASFTYRIMIKTQPNQQKKRRRGMPPRRLHFVGRC